jgi:hypothetical protein
MEKNAHKGYTGGDRDESEVCFIGKGLKKLTSSIEDIYVDGETYTDIIQAVRILKEKIQDKQNV